MMMEFDVVVEKCSRDYPEREDTHDTQIMDKIDINA